MIQIITNHQGKYGSRGQGPANNEMDRHQRDETKDEFLLGSASKKLGLQITPSWTLVLGSRLVPSLKFGFSNWVECFGADMSILFTIKVKILMLIKWSNRSPHYVEPRMVNRF